MALVRAGRSVELDRDSRIRDVLTLAFGAAAFAALLHPLLSAAESFGRYLPQPEIAADYLMALAWAALLGVTIFAWPISVRQRAILLVAWAAKVCIALGFMLYYEWSYPTLDAFAYFAAAREPQFDWSQVGIGRGTQNLEAFAWVHARLVPASYHAMKITCAFIGLIAVLLFHRASVGALRREHDGILVVLAFFPSVLFWSSIMGKDPIIFLGVAIYAYGVVFWQRLQRSRYLLAAVFGILLASSVRLWFAPILAGPLFLVALLGIRGAVRRIGFSLIGALILWAAVEQFQEQFALATLSELVSAANQWSQGWAEGGSAQLLERDFTSVSGLIRFLPLGMFTALFRPLPGEVNNLFGLLAGLENAALLAFVLLALVRARLREFVDPLVVWMCALVLIWAAFYGFVSYQNLGTAARFKLQILPTLVLLCIYVARRRPAASRALMDAR